MEQEKKNISRKNFFAWTAGIFSLVMVPSFVKFSGRKTRPAKKVKMLTEDGRLVEIDAVHIPSKKRKVKIADIHNWIKRKPFL